MDDFYDPDLEARLYAEVHYTNDTYSETNNGPRALAPEGDVIPGSIRSYAKKTGMFPKKHRALIDGVRAVGNHRVQEPVPRQEFRSNQSDVTKTIPSLLSLDPAIPQVPPRFTSANPPRFLLPNPPRFSSSNPPRYLLPTPPRFIPPNSSRFLLPNPPRLNSSISSRLGPQISPIPTGVTPLDSSRTNLFGKYPPDYPRSGHQLDPATISFDNSRLPSNTFNQAPNFQLNPFASDSFNSSLLDPYSSPRQDLPRFNQPDFIRLTQSLPNESKAQARKNSHMTNLKKLSKKVRNRRRREKIRSRKAVKGNKISIVETSPSTPRKNPNRAARSSDLNKSHDGTKSVVNLDDSIEVIEIQESTDDNLTHSNSGSPAGNHEMSQDESADELHESQKCLDEFDGNLGKSGDDNLDKSGDSLEKSDNSDKSKNLEMPNKNLDKSDGNLRTPNKNLDKSNKNLDKSGKNLDKSNDNLETPSKNSEQSDHNLDKTKNSNKSDENLTPSKNLDKSNRNLEKSDENLAKSNENVDKAENPQESGTPTKTPEKSKDTNLTSKSSPGPSSKDKNSKYNIKSPSKVSKSMASLDSSSDSESDGSIFEVPVPPKPAPPLINLNDSDESDESDSEEDSNDAPSKNNLEDDENENDEEESSEKQIWDCDDDDDDNEEDEEEEENSDSQKQVWNCEDDDVDDLDNHEENEEDTIVTNFVLNCSQVQKTVPTLEELRKVNLTNLEAKDDPPVLETITDTNEASTSTTTTTTMITADSGDKSRQPPPKSLGSDKKRPRDESRNRDDSLNPLKVSRCDNSKENTSFEEYVSKPMPVPLKAFYTDYRNSGCMNDVMDIQHKMSRNPNLWAILDADLVCRGGDKRLRCSYCHQPGHKRENCPDKRKPVTCHMCGEGGHSESRCPQRMCLTCGKKYSSYRKTCEYCRKLQCALCKSVGHLKIDCPDLWRRYHHTTTSGSVNIPPNPQEVLKPSHKLYCCNCTRRGHESSTCSRYRWSSHFPSPISVTSYTDGPSYPIREPVEIPPEAPIGIPDPSVPDVIVFHYQNRSEIPDNWCSDTIYPLEIPNISYNLESSKHQFPEFLTQHFPEESFYPIYVLIKLTVPDKLVVELKTPSAPSTLELKKLIIQWMSRREEDRKRMTQATRLPTRKAYLLNIMLNKFYSFITYSSLRGLTAYDEEFASQKRANILRSKMERRSDNSEKCKLRLANQLTNLEERFIKKLVSSLYNFKLAPSAEAIINDFHKLLNLLSTDNAWEGDEGRQSRVPQSMYMNFCWFNFELFTAHLSDYLVHAKESFQKRCQQGDSRITKKKGQSAKDLGLQLMFTRPERINFLSEGCKPGVLKVNKCKKNHIKYAKKLQCRAKLRAKNKRQKNKNTDNEGVTADSSENNDSSQTIGGSGNNDSSKNIDGSGNIESSKNPGGSKNNGGSKNSDGSKKPKEKPTSLIVDGKINVQVLQREKLACRAQAAVDLAKKHGLTKYVDRAEEIVKKIKAGGTVKKNTIEQLWSFLVKELRGNNISFQN